MATTLENEQRLALDRVLEGHNLLLLGQSGTGKSFLVKEMEKSLKTRGKQVFMTGTTGVASLNVGGITIHSWSGIGDGRYGNDELVRKLETDEHFSKYKENISKCDTLIVDEISMLSAKLFTQLEYICRKCRNNDKYFGGIQVIASGDFIQLPPVPDPLKLDAGEFCFLSPIFNEVFRHKIVLKKVMRQDEPDFVKAINDVSKGELPTDTLQLLQRLKRPLPPGEDPVRLCSRHFDCDVYNSSRLMDLEGEMSIFSSIDDGDLTKLKKISVPKNLHLKLNCRVMLVKNLSSTLVNGLQGIVIALDKDTVTVKFEKCNLIRELKRESFTVFSSEENKIVATRKQIPLVLAYSITIHKAQGLTLDRVVVDGSNIFQPGQLGVAIGRAKRKKGLRVINFNPKSVPKHDQSMFQFYQKPSCPFMNNLECCKLSFSVVEDLQYDFVEHYSSESDLSDFSYDDIIEIDEMLKETEVQAENLADAHVLAVTYQDTISSNELECPLTLNDIKSCVSIVVTNEQKIIKKKLENLVEIHPADTTLFVTKLYSKINDLCNKLCGDFESKKTDSKVWSKYYSEVYQYSNSNEYIALIESCLKKRPSGDDFSVFSKIFDLVTSHILEKKTEPLKKM